MSVMFPRGPIFYFIVRLISFDPTALVFCGIVGTQAKLLGSYASRQGKYFAALLPQRRQLIAHIRHLQVISSRNHLA